MITLVKHRDIITVKISSRKICFSKNVCFSLAVSDLHWTVVVSPSSRVKIRLKTFIEFEGLFSCERNVLTLKWTWQFTGIQNTKVMANFKYRFTTSCRSLSCFYFVFWLCWMFCCQFQVMWSCRIIPNPKLLSLKGQKVSSFVGLMGKRSQEEPGKSESSWRKVDRLMDNSRVSVVCRADPWSSHQITTSGARCKSTSSTASVSHLSHLLPPLWSSQALEECFSCSF